MNEVPSKTGPAVRAKDAVFYVNGLIGFFSVPIAFAKLLPEPYKIPAVIGSILFSIAIFLICYLGWSLIYFFRDEPLSGFTRKSADVYVSLCNEALPDLPKQRRNKVVMGIGLSQNSRVLATISSVLRQHANLQLTLSRELEREKLYNFRPLETFRQKANSSVEVIEGFLSEHRPCIAAICKLENIPNEIEEVLVSAKNSYSVLESAMQELIEDFSSLVEQQKEAESSPSKDWKRKSRDVFEREKTSLLGSANALTDLRSKVDEGKSHCESMVKHLN